LSKNGTVSNSVEKQRANIVDEAAQQAREAAAATKKPQRREESVKIKRISAARD
jgi:hypothetical protein